MVSMVPLNLGYSYRSVIGHVGWSALRHLSRWMDGRCVLRASSSTKRNACQVMNYSNGFSRSPGVFADEYKYGPPNVSLSFLISFRLEVTSQRNLENIQEQDQEFKSRREVAQELQ